MSVHGVTFRPIGPGDEREIIAVWQAVAGDRYPLRGRLWRQLTTDNPDFRATDGIVAVADVGERGPGVPSRLGPVVGFGYLARSRGLVHGRQAWPREGWLQVVAVSPGRQRQGIGRAIVERLLDGAREDGLDRVRLGGGIHYLFPGVPLDLPGLGSSPPGSARASPTRRTTSAAASTDGRRRTATGPPLPMPG